MGKQTSPQRLLRKREAAERFGISVSTLDRWLKAGKLEAVRPGERVVRIRESDVEALIRG